MKIAFCYESVLPSRGGCETYISDLARRLSADGHEVHLYACRWDAAALPESLIYHAIPPVGGPRFLRPWRFAAACERALASERSLVSIGFDKTWGQDVLYPQGGLHAASAAHNLDKYAHPIGRGLAWFARQLDLAHWSYRRLEQRQYLGEHHPLIVVNSHMVREHFRRHYQIDSDVRVIPSAIDPDRFCEHDRPRRRQESREQWGILPQDTVALFVAMNYRLKGLEPLLHATQLLLAKLGYPSASEPGFRLVVAGSPKFGKYQRLARRLGIADRVHFLGYCRETRNCYFAADFLVHPTFYDPCSLVALEALACGLPVITSCSNGASELMSPPREGYVIDDPHDHANLAWCMEQLLEPARRNACAQAARKAALQWTFDHHYRQLLQVLTEAAARKRAA
jgi:UDP-glucose:(heptosyl)LPS alpha-1,3-glucosyltransferase